jgi:hypothetical protein
MGERREKKKVEGGKARRRKGGKEGRKGGA